jgi:hypothetical protein
VLLMGGCVGVDGLLRRRKSMNMAIAAITSTARPPITPPTIAPTGVFGLGVGVGAGEVGTGAVELGVLLVVLLVGLLVAGASTKCN